MTRSLLLEVTIVRRMAAAALLSAALGRPAVAQTLIPIAPASVRPVPGVDPARTSIEQISRDGRRARITVASPDETSRQTLVIDLDSGTTLVTRPPVALPVPPSVTDVLSPDGSVLTYLEIVSGTTVVQQRHIDSGVVTERLRSSNAFQLGATSDAGQALAFVEGGVVTVDAGGARRAFADACPVIFDGKVTMGGPLELSGDGETLRYVRGYWSGHRPGAGPYGLDDLAGDVTTGAATCLDMRHPRVTDAHQSFGFQSTLAGEGRYLGTTGIGYSPSGTVAFHAMLVDTRSAEAVLLVPEFPQSVLLDVSDDARQVLMTVRDSVGAPGRLVVLDRQTGIITSLSAPDPDAHLTVAHLSGDGRHVVFGVHHSTPTTSQRHLRIADLDADRDRQHDAWETAFGLDPSDPADASLDADGDGRTNLQEFAAGTHPQGTPVRYFAEGAEGTFFGTSLALFNPATTSATANVRFLGPGGATVARSVTLAAQSPAYLEAAAVGLPFTEFAIVVESPTPIVAERRMTWDRLTGYGLHTGNGVEGPATQWHFAEGATIAGIQTFLLLQNPGTTPAAVTVRYLLPNGTTHERQHVVPASSRVTVWVNQEGAPLDAAEFATTVVADVPIVAERATYRDAQGQMFGAGAVASGVASPAQTWTFAEGATGSYFDTFLLLANPGTTPATVTLDFLRAGAGDVLLGLPLTRTYTVAPGQRQTIWVDQEDPALADVAVAARVTSDVPIVAERAMWWPGPTASTWHGAHVGTGTAAAGLMWGIADVEVGASTDVDTFVTVANLGTSGAGLRATVHLEDGRQLTRDFVAGNRFTIWPRHDFPEAAGQRFAMTIESRSVARPRSEPAAGARAVDGRDRDVWWRLRGWRRLTRHAPAGPTVSLVEKARDDGDGLAEPIDEP